MCFADKHSSMCERPNEAMTVESGYGSGSHIDPHDHHMYQQELASPLMSSVPGHMPQQGDYHLYGFGVASQGDALAGVGVGAGPLADSGGPSRESDLGVYAADGQYGLSVLSSAAAAMDSIGSPAAMMLPSSMEPRRSVPKLFVSDHGTMQEPSGGGGCVQWSTGIDDRPRNASGDGAAECLEIADGQGSFVCPECGKRRKRECDMRYVQTSSVSKPLI